MLICYQKKKTSITLGFPLFLHFQFQGSREQKIRNVKLSEPKTGHLRLFSFEHLTMVISALKMESKLCCDSVKSLCHVPINRVIKL